MTEKLYHQVAYLQEFEAVVTQLSEDRVALDSTAFYPGGGAQPSDPGRMIRDGAEFVVTKAKTEAGDIWHTVDPEGLREGYSIVAYLDWPNRYNLMRTYTAMHILCGVIWRDYGASVTGGNMTPGHGRMDFEFERMQKELVEDI